MTAYELAKAQQAYSPPTLEEIIKQQADRIAKYEQVLQSIANEQVELSHDKIKWQCEDHIRWAREALSLSGNNAKDVSNTSTNLQNGKE